MILTSSSWNSLDCYPIMWQAGYFMHFWMYRRSVSLRSNSNTQKIDFCSQLESGTCSDPSFDQKWIFHERVFRTHLDISYRLNLQCLKRTHYLTSVCLPERLTFLSDFGVSCDYSGPSIMHGRGFSFERPLWQVGTRSSRESGVEETQEASYLCPAQCLDGWYCWPCLTINKENMELSSHQERNFTKISCLCV